MKTLEAIRVHVLTQPRLLFHGNVSKVKCQILNQKHHSARFERHHLHLGRHETIVMNLAAIKSESVKKGTSRQKSREEEEENDFDFVLDLVQHNYYR